MTTNITPSQLHLVSQDITSASNVLAPFAVTDLFIQEAAKDKHSFLHFWTTIPTVILGMKDTRTPFLTDGLGLLKTRNYQTIARNSGGLAVISEPGVLNLSLVLPNSSDDPITVTQGYQLMTDLIQATFSPFTKEIEAKEISESYCPGEFDLSIHDKKFAGISQRRIGNGLAVMIYLSINGDQDARGRLVQQFYHASLKEDFGTNGYPSVDPDSMANLNDLLQQNWSVSEVQTMLTNAAETLFKATATPLSLSTHLGKPDVATAYEKHLTKMKTRNQDILKNGAI
ncbi:lipoate--protein ligase family protein [Vagococcus coleopterorum]|uniref:Lipoate--protein ligase family protein n=1 Tax=Vagococcus coleopterorum TaxID=2714946 RepID=A0A6G8AMJ6_9ENTE|nr:lipoate--protein ligase family protein [Vagococcus coleopterorum]QIL46304.1 lipoate--protein ligase family protein [Vagococcus coleopterorum]